MNELVFNLLPESLRRALRAQGISSPTEVQAGAIAGELNGQDALVTAPTGTGKTLAFLLPLTARLLARPLENALILSPTRELAQQTFEEYLKLTQNENLPAVLIIGGDNIHKQFAALRTKPRLIVATPGRVIDHMQRKSIDLRHTHMLVLDETDRMLDMGFIEDMRRIISSLPSPRQTLLFSATLPVEINELAQEFLHNPLRVRVGSTVSPVDLVVQEIVRLDIREKLPQLLHELNTRAGSVLIFTRTKHGAERLAKQLKLYGQKVNALHGDLRQNRRRQVLDFFKTQTVRVLVATDVAARGIDVPHIAHVINYDLPQSPQEYIHRIGRTGRAGSVGNAISFIAGDEAKWKEICKLMRFNMPVKVVEKTIRPLPAPKFVAHEEGAAHAKSRRAKKVQAVHPPAGARQRKELEAAHGHVQASNGEIFTQPAARPGKKKIKTFQKSSRAAVLAAVPAEITSFKTLKVGASKKQLRKQKKTRPQHAKTAAHKKFKAKHKRR